MQILGHYFVKIQPKRAMMAEGTMVDGIESDVIGIGFGEVTLRVRPEDGFFLGGFLDCRFQFAVDGDIDELIETGIGFETRSGFGATFDYMEIMVEETKSPLNAFRRVVVFEGVGEFLGGFDEFAVRYAGCRPGFGKMVGVELVETFEARCTTNDDMFAEFLTFLVGIHDTAVEIEGFEGFQIAHTTGMAGRNRRGRNGSENSSR